MSAPRSIIFVCYCRKGELASRKLIKAVEELTAMTLPGADLKLEMVQVGGRSDLTGSRRVTGSPVLDVIIDRELAGRFYGERTAGELSSIVHELLPEADSDLGVSPKGSEHA